MYVSELYPETKHLKASVSSSYAYSYKFFSKIGLVAQAVGSWNSSASNSALQQSAYGTVIPSLVVSVPACMITSSSRILATSLSEIVVVVFVHMDPSQVWVLYSVISGCEHACAFVGQSSMLRQQLILEVGLLSLIHISEPTRPY